MIVGLRSKCVLKEIFVPIVDLLFDYRTNKTCLYYENPQVGVAEKFNEFNFLVEWSHKSKAELIPFGTVEIESWKNKEEWNHHLEYESRLWKFQVTLDGSALILDFILTVLPHLAEKIEWCEVRFKANDIEWEGINGGLQIPDRAVYGEKSIFFAQGSV